MFKIRPVAIAALSLLAASATIAQAQERLRHRDRPLTITRHNGQNRGSGVQVTEGGNHIVAWGGFSANGYGYGRMGSEAARRAARNESVRYRTAGIYGYGFDGLGGTFDEGVSGGYNNPTYGNAYNSYVGYNGVPTAFAFGPSFANRHITDSEDDASTDLTGPTPGEMGYSVSQAALGLDTDD